MATNPRSAALLNVPRSDESGSLHLSIPRTVLRVLGFWFLISLTPGIVVAIL